MAEQLSGLLSSGAHSLDMKEDTSFEARTSTPNEAPIRAPDELRSVGLLEFLETDDRPILIFDLASETKTIPVYGNPRSRDVERTIGDAALDIDAEGVEQRFRGHKHAGFADWAVSVPLIGSLSAVFGGMEWTYQTLRGRWRVVAGQGMSQYYQALDLSTSGSLTPDLQTFSNPPTERPRIERYISAGHNKLGPQFKKGVRQNSLERQLHAFKLYSGDISVFPTSQAQTNEFKLQSGENSIASQASLGRYDFTGSNPPAELSDFIRFFLFFNWESTELGPIKVWSVELRRMVNLMLSDPRAVSIYWGPKQVLVYNEAFMTVTGNRHPFMLGKPYTEAWGDLADHFRIIIDRAYDTGVASTINDALFYLERHGYQEEAYYSFSIIPFGTSEGVSL